MRLQHFLVGLMVATAFVIGTSLFIAESQANTGIVVNDTNYQNTYDKLNDTLETADQMSEQLQGSEVSSSFFNPLQVATSPILQIIFDSYGIVIAMISDIADDLNIQWLGVLILGIISILLIIAIMNAIFGRNI
jgi:hypothetical protein